MAQAVPQLQRFKWGGNWARFLEQFEDYVVLTGQMARLDLLLLALVDKVTWDKIGRVKMEAGDDAANDPRANVGEVVAFYREAYTRVEDRRSHQAKFTMLRQKEGESIEDYGKRVENLGAKAYPVEAVRVAVLNGTFIRGILDARVKMQLLQLDEMNYMDLVNRALRCEQAASMIEPGRGRPVFGAEEVEGAHNVAAARQDGQSEGSQAYMAENCTYCNMNGHVYDDCWRRQAEMWRQLNGGK